MRFKDFINILTLRLVSASLLFSAACTEKGTPLQVHEPDRRPPAERTRLNPVESAAPSARVQTWEDKLSATQDPLHDVLLPLSVRVLESPRVTDPASLSSRSVQDELSLLNRLVLQTPPDQRQSPAFETLCQRYEAALNMECGTLKESCTGLGYLKISASSAQVVKLLAQRSTDNYFKNLLFALELKNHSWDKELIQMLFVQPARNLSQTEFKFREAARSLLGSALQIAQDRTGDPAAARNFLDAVGAWDLVDGPLKSFDSATQESFYAMISQAHYMYLPSGALQPRFQERLLERETNPHGILAHQRTLRTQTQFVPGQIGAKFITHLDELDYIIDRVFQVDLSPASGARLFAGSRKTITDLRAAVENHLRMEFLLALQQSSAMAKDIFTANVEGQDLLMHAIRTSATVKRVWSGFMSHAQPLQNFTALAVKSRPDGASAGQSLKDLFESIPKTINLVSVYPHTMLLFHILSQKRFQLIAPVSHQIYNSGDLINMLFSQAIEPILSYTEETRTLSPFELVHAFDMAVRTGLFAQAGIDVDFFIADTLHRLSESANLFIDRNLNEVETRFKQSPTYLDFQRACSALKGKKVHRSFYFAENIESPYYGNLIGDAFRKIIPVPQGPGSSSTSYRLYRGIFYQQETYAETIEKARLDLGTYSRLGKAMLQSYRLHLVQTALSEVEIGLKTAATVKALDGIEQRRTRVLFTGQKWFEDIGSCYWAAAEKNTQVEDQVLENEKAYLRQVYRDIQKLRRGVSAAEKVGIQKRVQLSGLPSDFKGLDRISADGYLYSQVDLQVRMAKYVTQGLTTDEGFRPPIDSSVGIEFGERLDVEVDTVRGSQQVFLANLADQQEFVDSALKVIFNGKKNSNFVSWHSEDDARILNWANYLKSLVSLYRLELETTNHNSHFTSEMILKGQEDILHFTRITAQERELYTTLHQAQKLNAISLDRRLVLFDPNQSRITDTWGLFDFAVRLSEEDQLGFLFDDSEQIEQLKRKSIRPSRRTTGLNYYASRAVTSRGSLVLPYNHSLDLYFDQLIGHFIKSETLAVQEFHRATRTYLHSIEQRLPESRPRAEINVFISIHEPLLNDSIIPSFDSKLQNFNRATGFCYTSDTHCPEFQ